MLPFLSKQTVFQLSDTTAMTLINGYQRHLSPIKGFKCAAGQVYGTARAQQWSKALCKIKV